MHFLHTPLLLPMLPMHLAGAQKVMRNVACRNSHVKAKRRRHPDTSPRGRCAHFVSQTFVYLALALQTIAHPCIPASLNPSIPACSRPIYSSWKMKVCMEHGAWSMEHAIRIIPGAAAVAMGKAKAKAKANIIYVCYIVCLYFVLSMLWMDPLCRYNGLSMNAQ